MTETIASLVIYLDAAGLLGALCYAVYDRFFGD